MKLKMKETLTKILTFLYKSRIGHKDVSISGVNITSVENGWYWANLNIANQLPSGADIISAFPIGAWSVKIIIMGSGKDLLFQSPSSMTVPSNRKARVYYIVGGGTA